MRFNKKRIIAILVFLLLSFFMITFGNPVNNTAIVTRNVKFIDSYNDKLLADKKVELGKAVTAPTVPKHKDLVFINWYIKGTDTVANLNKILTNSTFVTKYADDKNNNGIADNIDKYYTVKFIDGLDNSLLKTEKVLVGLDATAPLIPTHEGYTFGSWDLSFENVKKNITVTGIFNINSYNLNINYKYAKNSSEASTSYNNSYIYNSNYSVISPLIAGYKADKLIVSGIMPASDQTLEVLYYANKNTSYKVEHYKEALDGSYKLVQTDDMLGETDTLTKAVSESYIGFTVKSFDQLNINGNGDTLVKIYYDRNSYTLTYKVDGNVYKTYTFKYEEAITPEVKPTKEGYTFNGWTTIPSKMPANNLEITGSYKINQHILSIYYQNECGLPILMPYINIVDYGTNYNKTSPNIAGYTVDTPVVSGTMPDEDKLIFVTYVANKNTPYKIEYYKNGVKVETENKTGTTDTLASIVPNLNKYPGYYYDAFNFNNWLADFIHGDGSTTLKVYYKAKTNTSYKVKHYTENLDGSWYLYATDNKTGTTDKPTSAQAKNISGFTVQSFTQKNIDGNGSTVVEIYYTRNAYQLIFVLNNGNPNVTATLKYGQTIIIPPIAKLGYTFNIWTPSVPSTMPASNATYSANWNINSYKLTINYKYSDESIAATKYEQSYNYNLGYSVTSPLVAGYTANIPVVSGTIPANDVVVDITYTANTDTAYQVKHYIENLDGSYSLIDTEDLTGTTNMPTNAVAKSLTGFTVQAFTQKNIDGNGSTVVEIYYTRNTYNLAYKVNGVEVSSTDVKYQTPITPLSNPELSGYTFSGWSSIPSIMPAANVEVNGSFTINSYKLTINYKYSDESIAATKYEQSYNYNLGYSVTSPLVAGYRADILVVSGTIPANDVVVNVTYTANTDTAYKVKHYTENLDGSYSLIDTEDLTGTTNTLTSAVAKSLTGFTVQAFDQENINGNGSTVVEIHYSRNSYTLTFKPENGSVDITSTEKYGASISVPTVTRTGYTFKNWTPSVPGTMPASNATYTASWDINSYTLTFVDTNDEKIIRNVNWGDTLTDIPTITPITGYTCVWDRTDFTNITANDTVNAVCNVINYTVTYNLNTTADIIGASHSNALNVYNINTALYTIANATSTSDDFDGWFTLPVGGTKVTTLAGGAIGDVELYAHWSKKAYTVDFEENGGSNVLPLANVYYGSTIAPQTTTRTGFIFDDWYKEETLANKWLFATDTVTKDLTLYANWRAEKYNLVFNINDSGVVNAINPSNPDEYTIADNITFNNASSKSHTFLGWFTTADNTGIKVTGITAGTTTGNQTYYAHWETKSFDLTVNANGGVWTGTTPQTLDYGESLTISNPTKDGYTFSGWTLTGNDSALIGNTFTMGSENATLTANWLVRTDLDYTVYYKLEGTTTDIQSPSIITNKTFGETYTETAPVIAGYEKLDTTKDVLITTGTNEIIFYYRAIANITASLTSTSSSGSSVVSYGDTITYTLTGINTGTGAGILTAKDLVLMAELSGLDVELIDTGLTAGEIADRNALLSVSGLIKTINAGDTYTLVFKVRVLGNAGSSISNKLTYNVGSDPELTDTLKNYNIEKTMSLRAISEIGVNVVLTLDISGSMEGSKFSSMKSAATTFIDTIFPSGVDNEGTEICVVTFSKPWWDLFGNNAMLRGCTGGSGAKTPAQLKSIINGLETGSSTPYTSALSVVSDTLDSMENRNTDNDNIVVFLSDGEPTDGNGYIATANALKASGTVIYSIGFEVTGSAETTLRSLATSSSYYYTGTVSNIESVFSNIASEISTESKRSVNGVVEISNVNTTKVIEFKVNGSTSGYPTTVANALSQGYLINNGTTYSIDLTKFNASSSIVFTYYKN